MNRVVVTGMGVIAPTGKNKKELWDSAMKGTHGIAPVTQFDTSEYKATLAAEVKDFDPSEYMEFAEARKMDRYAQLAVAAAKEAVEDSGVLGEVDPHRFGVYIGSGIGGMQTFSSEYDKLLQRGPKRVSVYFIPMLIANMAAAQVAIKYGAKSSCLPSLSACATSTNTIGEAYRAIKHGYADVILAGGSEASITPIGFAGFINMGALSLSEDPDRASIPFDKERNGFVMGEGAGVLVLENFEHAQRRGAKIYAEITGYGSTCDAYHLTAPDPEAEGAVRAIRESLEEIPAGGIYANAHGTSTPLNDALETKALKEVFADRLEDLHVSSTKSMTGHLLGAAGAVEAIYAIETLRHQCVPPTVGYRVPDESCDLDITPNHPKQAELSLAISISLGFGGHNACLAFQRVEDES